MNIGIWGWDTANTLWRKVHVDAFGNLQVDVLTSALPAGGATAANQVTQITALQLIDDLRNALGSVNTDDLQVDIKDIADGEIKCYGYDGAAWQTLRVDAAMNLKVAVAAVPSTDTSTIAQVSVGVASTAVLAANANRILAEFVNDSDTVIYLALGAAAVLNRGIRLNASGGSFEIGATNLYTGAVKAISSVAAKNLTVSEG